MIRAFGIANRFPFVPPASTIATVDAAIPNAIVDTSALHSWIASYTAIAALQTEQQQCQKESKQERKKERKQASKKERKQESKQQRNKASNKERKKERKKDISTVFLG
jgi:mannitol-specific phosphotransferase system IIBC component